MDLFWRVHRQELPRRQHSQRDRKPESPPIDATKVIDLLRCQPTPELLRAIEIIVGFIAEAETDSRRAPRRTDARDKLKEYGAAARLLASGLKQAPPPWPTNIQEAPRISKSSAEGRLLRIASHLTEDPWGWGALLEILGEAAERCANQIPLGKGTKPLVAVFGRPDGRLLAAAAAIKLMKHCKGHRPGHGNPDAQELCAILWQMAGFEPTEGQKAGDTDAGSWDRHLRKVLGKHHPGSTDAKQVAAAYDWIEDAFYDSRLLPGRTDKQRRIAALMRDDD